MSDRVSEKVLEYMHADSPEEKRRLLFENYRKQIEQTMDSELMHCHLDNLAAYSVTLTGILLRFEDETSVGDLRRIASYTCIEIVADCIQDTISKTQSEVDRQLFVVWPLLYELITTLGKSLEHTAKPANMIVYVITAASLLLQAYLNGKELDFSLLPPTYYELLEPIFSFPANQSGSDGFANVIARLRNELRSLVSA